MDRDEASESAICESVDGDVHVATVEEWPRKTVIPLLITESVALLTD